MTADQVGQRGRLRERVCERGAFAAAKNSGGGKQAGLYCWKWVAISMLFLHVFNGNQIFLLLAVVTSMEGVDKFPNQLVHFAVVLVL